MDKDSRAAWEQRAGALEAAAREVRGGVIRSGGLLADLHVGRRHLERERLRAEAQVLGGQVT